MTQKFILLSFLLLAISNASTHAESKNVELMRNIEYFSSEISKDSIDIKELINLAENGDANAQYELGVLYFDGEKITQNYTEAVKWFTYSAEQGYAIPHVYLGHCYANGLGVNKSHEEAVKWYSMAAEQGDALAQWERCKKKLYRSS